MEREIKSKDEFIAKFRKLDRKMKERISQQIVPLRSSVYERITAIITGVLRMAKMQPMEKTCGRYIALILSLFIFFPVLMSCAVTGPEISREEEKRTATILKQKAHLYRLQQVQRITAAGIKILEQIPVGNPLGAGNPKRGNI
jgi:hypothetical protein